MLVQTIEYEDFNGVKRTEDFYFNLTEEELIMLEVSETGGLAERLKEISETQDPQEMLNMIKRIILLAYGEKSADGRYFEKSEELRNRFASTNAYSKLFMQLNTDDKAAAKFMNGIIPQNLAEAAKKLPQDFKQKETPAIVTTAVESPPTAAVTPKREMTEEELAAFDEWQRNRG